MAALLIKSIPLGIHQRLRLQAERHHRSMNREVITILEKELGGGAPAGVGRPVVPSKPLSAAWVRETTRALRDNR